MDLSRRSFAYTGLSTATFNESQLELAAGFGWFRDSWITGNGGIGGCLECFESVPSQSSLGRERVSDNKIWNVYSLGTLFAVWGHTDRGNGWMKGGEGPRVAAWIMRRIQYSKSRVCFLC